MLEMAALIWQDLELKVRELQARFDAFEADNRMSDCIVTQIDEELEEGRVNVEKLDKRVRELETYLPELIAEKVATLKTENAELRHHLNATVDTLNAVVKIINDQVIPRFEPADGPNPDTDDGVDRHHYLEEVNELTQEEWNNLLQNTYETSVHN